MFSSNHFIWLGICAVLIVLGSLLSVSGGLSFRKATWIVCGISAASELCKIFTHIEESENGGVLGAEYLPFHLCSILIFLFFYLALAPEGKYTEQVKSFLVPMAILGGILAILIPTSGVNFRKPFAYQCFLYHSGILWYAIYLLATGQVAMGKKAYTRNLGILACLVIVMLWINSALAVYDTNFFYLVRPPMENLPVLNLNNGWMAYFLTIVALGITLVSLVHLPFLLKERKAVATRKK